MRRDINLYSKSEVVLIEYVFVMESFEDLPDELLIEIFSFLSLKDCSKIYGKLNNRFNVIINSKKFHLEFDSSCHMSNFVSLAANIYSVTFLNLPNLPILLPKLINVKELSYIQALFAPSDKFGAREYEAVKECRTLIKLRIPASSFKRSEIIIPHIKHLVLDELCCRTFHKIVKVFPNVETLESTNATCCSGVCGNNVPILKLISLKLNPQDYYTETFDTLTEVRFVSEITIKNFALEHDHKEIFNDILIKLEDLDIGIRPPTYTIVRNNLIITRRDS